MGAVKRYTNSSYKTSKITLMIRRNLLCLVKSLHRSVIPRLKAGRTKWLRITATWTNRSHRWWHQWKLRKYFSSNKSRINETTTTIMSLDNNSITTMESNLNRFTTVIKSSSHKSTDGLRSDPGLLSHLSVCLIICSWWTTWPSRMRQLR